MITRVFAVLSCALVVALAGCSAVANSPVVPQAQVTLAPATAPMTPSHIATGARTVTVASDGTERSYVAMVPADADRQPLPLVVVLHGAFVTGSAELARTGFGRLADEGTAVVVAPESIGPAWNSDGGCCAKAAAEHVNDAGFVSTVMRDVQRTAHTDPRRTSIVGYSSGGKLAYNVACQDSSAIAAVATYGAGPQRPCDSSTPVTFVVGYGDQDTNEPPVGAPPDNHGVHQPQSETAAQLRTRDGCTGPPTREHTVGPAAMTTWGNCRAPSTVTQVIWRGSTHQWPGSVPDVPPQASGEALFWPILSAARSSG
ncbi:MAG: dienelactone hydrolase family protein [Mycobacteriaceae bacterium]